VSTKRYKVVDCTCDVTHVQQATRATTWFHAC